MEKSGTMTQNKKKREIDEQNNRKSKFETKDAKESKYNLNVEY